MTKRVKTQAPPTPERAGPAAPPLATHRQEWLDIARGLGMALVFFGHFAETAVATGSALMFGVYKLVYSFHVPLFFVLAGMGAARARGGATDGGVRRFWRRVAPFVFFNLLGLAGFLARDVSSGQAVAWRELGLGVASLVRGFPSFNMVTWFLICLAVTEVLGGALLRLSSPPRRLAGAALCAVLGLVASRMDEPALMATTGIVYNFWFVHEALVMVFFYIVGAAIAARLPRFDAAPLKGRLAAVSLALAVLLLTFSLNDGPFAEARARFAAGPVVVVGASSHGHPLWFFLTALSGCAAVVLFSRLLAASPRLGRVGRPLAYVGRHSLAYLGLAGLVLHFANAPLAERLAVYLGRGFGSALAACLLQSVVALLVCAPVAVALRRVAPWALGYRSQG